MGEEIRRKAKVVHKHEIAANWALSNYVPEIGEIVFYDPDDEFDYTRQKNGNGIDKVADLPFENDEVKTYIDTKMVGYTSEKSETGFEGYENDITIRGNSVSLSGGANGVSIYSGDSTYIENILKVESGVGVYIVADDGDKKIATEEYVDNAIANIDIPGGEATIPDDLTINSLVIGEGEAADLSIAGGTTDIDTYGEKAGLSTTEIATLKAALALSGGVKKSSATAPLSIALGANNESTASGAISLGYGNKNSGFNSAAIGAMNTVTGDSAFAYGYNNTINGDFGVAFGQENIAGELALAGGILSEATGKSSIAFGNENIASGEYAVALGGDTTASGIRSFASGTETTASGNYSHAQNEETTASGESSTAMGYKTEASGTQALAGGRETIASGKNSVALGEKTEAKHAQSFTAGYKLSTKRDNQTVIGEWNAGEDNALFIVGNGSGSGRSNAFIVNKDGTAYLNGKQLVDKEYIDAQISALRDEIKAYINEVFLNGAW